MQEHQHLAELKRLLTERFSSEVLAQLFDDAYLTSVLNGKTKGKPRQFNYAVEKLMKAAELRLSSMELVKTGLPQEVKDNLQPFIYVYGFDNEKRPIIWLNHAARTLDDDLAERVYPLQFEYIMEMTISRFLSSSAKQVRIIVQDDGKFKSKREMQSMRKIISKFVAAHPDRLYRIDLTPASLVVRAVKKILHPLLPEVIRTKIHLHGKGDFQQALAQEIDLELLPQRLGGPKEHADIVDIAAMQQRQLLQYKGLLSE